MAPACCRCCTSTRATFGCWCIRRAIPSATRPAAPSCPSRGPRRASCGAPCPTCWASARRCRSSRSSRPRHRSSPACYHGGPPERPPRSGAPNNAATGRTMKTKAAVAWQAGKPLTIEEVELGGPKAGEVLVEIKATGICHTDYYTLSGADPEGIFPAILGHEGAGVVVDVGPGVKSLKKDDHVIPLYTPECRQCKFCLSQKTNLCQSLRSTQGRGLMPDATSRFSIDGKPIYHYMGTSTFSNYIVVPEIVLAKIREDAPFDKVCYIGCGVTTGVGAVLFTAKVEAGANVVVFGLGGIGLNVIQAAKMVGADKIIGVDINPARQEMARKFGMTHFINPSQVENVVDAIVQLTDGGADYSFECIGNTTTMRQALECCHKGWGQSIVIGVAAAGEEISTRPFQLVTGRVWKGSAFGGARGRTDVPKIVDWYMEGKLNIDDLITHRLPLERINEGFDLMKSGESIRSVVIY